MQAKKTRCKTRDIAIQFRMQGGFPGDVNRTHPATITPELMDSVSPVAAYGYPCLIDSAADAGQGGIRGFATTDHSDATPVAAWGVLVRPYPTQQQNSTNYGAASIGAATPPTSGVVDTLRSGFISVAIPAGQAPIKGSPVYVWCAASTGAHVFGGFEAVYSAGNTVQVSNATFNSTPDTSGNVEISFNV